MAPATTATPRWRVRKAAVLGAGVMGAQIAAHLVNVRVPVVLYDLPASDGPKNGIVARAVEGLKAMKPPPLALADDAAWIVQANYDDDLGLLAECDLVIEAIAERMDWKIALYDRIAASIAPQAILASNTSGLSVTGLAEALPAALRPRFCGVHFFNPPRYMALVELVAAPSTDKSVLDQLETFVTSTLGKSVVRALDTPNFIANRIGAAGMLATMIEADRFGFPVDLVDDLTGTRLGRAKSGTFRTADVVGLDTMAHVICTLQAQLPDDPFAGTYAVPPALEALIARGALGQKTGAGYYKKVGRDILRLDPATGDHVPGGAKADDIIGRILKKPAPERLKLLRESKNPQAQFLWAVLRDSFHYGAVHLADVAETARDVDLAMRWGFGSRQGPFELWQEAGWTTVAGWVQADIDAGRALATVPLPDWVRTGPVADAGGVHTPAGSWSASQRRFVPRRDLPVYARQPFREDVAGSGAPTALSAGTEIHADASMRLWTLDGAVLIASLRTKLHLIDRGVTDGLVRAVELAEAGYDALVLWSPDDVFSAGANLEVLMPVFMTQGAKGVEPEQRRLQDAMLRIRHAQVPVVAAVRGLALGGGCELALHCARRVAAMESYIGLVEVGVGLLPGGGGSTWIARRAAEMAAAGNAAADVFSFLRDGYTHAATGTVSTSAVDARRLGYLLADDVVVAHPDELLHVALSQAAALAASGWRPPPAARFPVAGRAGIANIRAQLVNMRDGGFITGHDFDIGLRIAEVVCGGDVEPGTLVDEAWLMALERRHFGALLDHPKTQARILGMLQTGNPVRN